MKTTTKTTRTTTSIETTTNARRTTTTAAYRRETIYITVRTTKAINTTNTKTSGGVGACSAVGGRKPGWIRRLAQGLSFQVW